MREQIKDKSRIRHIIEACDILLQRRDSDTLDIISSDPIKFYGYVKLIEIIGEATYKLTKEFRQQHPEIPWDIMEGMRHVLVHDYYKISPEKLWLTVCDDIPILRQQIAELISKL